MINTYNIQGMTCNGCRNKVEMIFSKIKGVSQVFVDLERSEAIIESDQQIEISDLQQMLPSKYTIRLKEEDANDTINEQSKFQQLKPLFLILFYILTASILLHKDDWSLPEMMLDFMGLFYLVFSFFKFLDVKGFASSFIMYDPLAKVIPFYGWLYPFIETTLALMLLFRFKVSIALMITLVILGITSIGVAKTLLDKKRIQCACLGTALNLPMTEATFIENAIMLIMAILMLVGV